MKEEKKADQQTEADAKAEADAAEADAEREKKFQEHMKKTEAELIFLNCPFC